MATTCVAHVQWSLKLLVPPLPVDNASTPTNWPGDTKRVMLLCRILQMCHTRARRAIMLRGQPIECAH
jgi:hypothetical protein